MRRAHAWSFLFSIVALTLTACGSVTPAGTTGSGGSGATGSTTGSGATTGSGGTPELAGACPSEDEVGYFVVQQEVDYSVVSGEVLDAVLPSKILENVGQDGDCTLWRRQNPFCDPPCNPGETCSLAATCIPYPLPKSVGAVTITGLLKPVSMAALEYYDTNMPFPAFSPGAAVELVAEGAADPGFTLHGEGFAPISIPKETWVVKKGQPLTVTWTPDSSSKLERVRLRFNIDQHGNSPVELVCEVADTGSKTVPAALLDQLITFGVTGFPSGHITRHTVDSTKVGGGCVRFEVLSHLLGDLEVADHIPCDPSHPCPMGKTCDFKTGTCL
jgi:hypothetical protein